MQFNSHHKKLVNHYKSCTKTVIPIKYNFNSEKMKNRYEVPTYKVRNWKEKLGSYRGQ